MDGREVDVEIISPLWLVVDLFLIALSLSTVPIFEGSVAPFRSGFFCDDDTIRFPYKTSTINDPKLYTFCFTIPLLTISALEVWAFRRGDASRARRRVSLLGRELPVWSVQWVRRMLLYCYGLGCQEFLVHVGKFTVGRLRPHFLAVCQPDVQCNGTSRDPHQYILDYKCVSEEGFAAAQSRLSFPSGHSAMALYAAVFTVLYMERRLHWPERAMVTKTAVQALVVALAWFTALSRIMDHKHHWGDVTTGSIIGALVAWFWVYRVILIHSDSSQDGVVSTQDGVLRSQETYVFPMSGNAEKP